MKKHLLLIHGRATKPDKPTKERLARAALARGLSHADKTFAEGTLEDHDLTFRLVYYGDINNTIMVDAEPERKDEMVKGGDDVWYEPPDSYDADLKKLLRRKGNEYSRAAYRKLLDRVPDSRARDDVARIVSPIASLVGLSGRLIRRVTPDLGAYLTSRDVGSKVRERLQKPLREALLAGDDVALVSHSMGCIVSYDVLWKLSRMSEHRDVREKKISLWVTIGNPLGEPAVKGSLYDADEPEDGRYPTDVRRWVNLNAKDDFVAHDGDVGDDFREMVERGLVGAIEDLPRMYNFWAGRDGSNPHKLYGYLASPELGRLILQWLQG